MHYLTTDENQRVIAYERAVDLCLNGTITAEQIVDYANRGHQFLTGATDSAKAGTTVVNNHTSVGAPAVGAQVHVD